MEATGSEAKSNREMTAIYTIGHSTRDLQQFIQLLQENEVTCVIDIRTIPRSRHNPQFNRETLPAELMNANIEYMHMPGLGGLRHTIPESPNTAWRNKSFQGFADYMLTDAFRESLAGLIELSKKQCVCLMCAEAVPWRCHRSLVADALLVRGLHVEHIMGPGHTQLHRMTPFAKVEADKITYPSDVPSSSRKSPDERLQ